MLPHLLPLIACILSARRASLAVLGLAAARHLQAAAAISDTAAYMLQCAYAAKLSMLFLPEAQLTVPVLGMLLAATPPLLLHKAGPSQPREELDHPGRERRHRLMPWQGLGLAAAVVLAVVAARFAIFDIAQFVLDRRPSGGWWVGRWELRLHARCTAWCSAVQCSVHPPGCTQGVAIASGSNARVND
jgi:hypothetical protein